MLYASGKHMSPWLVFAAISVALVLATGLGVMAGHALSAFVSEKMLAYIAGVGFMLLGGLSIYRAVSL